MPRFNLKESTNYSKRLKVASDLQSCVDKARSSRLQVLSSSDNRCISTHPVHGYCSPLPTSRNESRAFANDVVSKVAIFPARSDAVIVVKDLPSYAMSPPDVAMPTSAARLTNEQDICHLERFLLGHKRESSEEGRITMSLNTYHPTGNCPASIKRLQNSEGNDINMQKSLV